MYHIGVGHVRPVGPEKCPHRNAKAPMKQYNVGYPMERIGRCNTFKDTRGEYVASNW